MTIAPTTVLGRITKTDEGDSLILLFKRTVVGA